VIEIHLTWLLIATELFLLLAIALAGLLLASFRRRRRDRQAAQDLVDIIKQAEPQRTAATRELLERHHGSTGDGLEEALHAIIRAEKLLYQRVITLYIKRDALALRALPIEVEALSEPLRGLLMGGDSAAPGAGESAAVNTEELARLREENEGMQQELQITMETMSRMLSDYAAMFGGGAETAQSETFKALLAGARDEVPPDVPPDSTDKSSSAGDTGSHELDSLSELEEINRFDVELDWGSAASPDTNAGQPLADGAPRPDAQIDLSEDTPADMKGRDASVDIDDDLADIWANALGEQGSTAKPKS